MKCRVKTRMLLAVVIAFCVVHHQTEAQIENDAQPAVISSYPSWIIAIMTRLTKWSPPADQSDACKLSFSSAELQPQKCKLNLDLSYFQQFKSKLFFNYDISDHRQFQLYADELSPDVKIRGLLALQPNQKRPLVIFRMGIHGNRDEVLAERFFLKILYEDLGVHVLMLENLTSHAYLIQNSKISIGGLEEGLHTFFIINKLKKGKFTWSSQVTDIHLLGLSLGSQGVFVTTMLDEQNQNFIKSSQVFCPLVNFEETFATLQEPSYFNTFVDFWNWRRLISVQDRLKDYSSWPLVRMLYTRKPMFTPMAMSWLNEQVTEPVLKMDDFRVNFPNVKFPDEFKAHIQKSHSLFELNNFWPIYKNTKTPFQIVATPLDPLVNNATNSDRIRKGTQPGQFTKTSFMELQGVHCALAAEYEWPFLVEVVRRGLGLKN